MAKKVKVHSAGLDSYWYAKHIGQVFEVEDELEDPEYNGERLYAVTDRQRWIVEDDAEVIEEETEEPKVERGFIEITEGRWWYEDKVGQILRVISFIEDYEDEDLDLPFTVDAYKVVDPTDGENGWGYVLAQDCQEWEKPTSEEYAEDLGMAEIKPAESVVDPYYVKILEEEIARKEAEGDDMVEHPSHYTSGKFEAIEVIEDVTKGYEDGYVAYCVGNTQKYIKRAPFKHVTPLEDLRKAAKYLEFAIKHLEADAD